MGTVLLHRRAYPIAHWMQCVSVPFSMGTVLLRALPLGEKRTSLCFSPLLDGDGVASALELPHSTPLLAGLRAHFREDGISAPKRARSANSIVTTRLHNSLRTRIPHTASSPPWAPASCQSRSPHAYPPWPAEPHAATIHQWEPEIRGRRESGRRIRI